MVDFSYLNMWSSFWGQLYPGYAGVFTGEIRIVGTRSIASLQEACALHPEYQRLVDAIISPGANDQPRALICSERDRLGRTSSLVSQLEFFCLEYNMVPVARYSYFLESAHFGVVARFLPPSAKIRVHAIIYGRTQAAGSLPGKDRT